MWLWGEFRCITMTINIWTFFFVVVFNNQYTSAIEYNSLEQCLEQQYEVEKDPSARLWTDPEDSWWSLNAHWVLAAIGMFVILLDIFFTKFCLKALILNTFFCQ